jgi:hypothetical protein
LGAGGPRFKSARPDHESKNSSANTIRCLDGIPQIL